MELAERILKILENSGLTPSEFADKIEVQRSSISHITSGRNKPSLEFLLKIKKSFPEIDTDWLIFGIDKRDEIETEKKLEVKKLEVTPTLFDEFEKEEIIENSDVLEKEVVVSKSRILKKIILIYNDGSFEDFQQD